ncbi:putative fumarylacetoacetate [Halobacteriovorax marinus SJ]|uniref:Fumarylacetoacetate n=1 Tax=Halobacteriovorax marinus (strain ATCC BAA-682 / DSM 15412 / SJ) TaxID=862908 RepID=E1X380_HALMS|nr:fumarylacetoacetate hydrolase family protein [Halobacteriovorax marinus]CBW25175.1 putative fumarylacetoacetate [Halobacteriovorax marinus SJ]
MKICHYRNNLVPGGSTRLGILDENEGIIIDPNFVWACDYEREGKYNPYERANRTLPSSLFSVLNLCDDPLDSLQDSYGLFQFLKLVGDLKTRNGTPTFYKLDDESISLTKPLDKIATYRDFYAHEKHVAKGFEKRNEPIPEAWYEIPAYYKGSTHGFIGPEEEVLWPGYTNILDYELELGMVVGKEGINIKEEDALKHIFGFTILNDISARDIQKKEMAIRLGPAKGKDFCSIIGPVITTIDEFDGIEPDLLMTAKINGEEWSRGQSGDSHFSFAQMITHVSQDEWVLPGDLFGSGTVGTGCGLEIDKWIQPGDEIELFVEGIGTLKNKIGSKNGKF